MTDIQKNNILKTSLPITMVGSIIIFICGIVWTVAQRNADISAIERSKEYDKESVDYQIKALSKRVDIVEKQFEVIGTMQRDIGLINLRRQVKETESNKNNQ